MTTEEELVRIVVERLGRLGARCVALRCVPNVIFAVRLTRTGEETLLLIPADISPENRAATLLVLENAGVVNQVEEY